MSFEVKDWKNGNGGGTKLNAAGLVDLEERLASFAEESGGGLSKEEIEKLIEESGGGGTSGMGVVVYDAEAEEWPARPEFEVVTWIGPTEPPDAVDNDTWIEA